MSDKQASTNNKHELTTDEITTKEANAVSDALFDDAMSGLRNAFRLGVAVAERMEDNSASFWGELLGNEAREKHTKKLEDEAMGALKQGRVDAAKHLLKRDLAYTMHTQGFDDDDSQRLLKEVLLLGQLDKQRVLAPAPVHKPYEACFSK